MIKTIKYKVHIIVFGIIAVLTCAACFLLFGCSKSGSYQKPQGVTAVLLPGEHYSVDESRKHLSVGESAVFTVTLERGYKITDSIGDACRFSDNLSFVQTVTFSNLVYDTVASLVVQPVDVAEFTVHVNADCGSISVESALGAAGENAFYSIDKINVIANQNDGYRFLCWSVGGYVDGGGEFFSYENIVSQVDFNNIKALYANFKSLANTENMILYEMDNGLVLEQDCSALLVGHSKANTYTAKQAREFGANFNGRMLSGWQTESGEYVGLGNRVAVNENHYIMLYPVWKDYDDTALYSVANADGGVKITAFNGEPNDGGEAVIPCEVGGKAVVAIGGGAFSGKGMSTVYIPDSVLTVESGAFSGCASLTDIFMSDNVTSITDNSFSGCVNLTALHLNAVLKPRYITGSYARRSDLCNDLELDNGNKIAIYGGSSIRFGYNSALSSAILSDSGFDYSVYNMGVDKSFCAYFMYKISEPYLTENDIILAAPEHGATAWYARSAVSSITSQQAAVFDIRSFYICEGDWGLLANINLQEFCNVFPLFTTFNRNRLTLRELDYTDYHTNFDGEVIMAENGQDKAFNIDTSIAIEIDAQYIENAFRKIYEPLMQKGLRVYVTFPSLNREYTVQRYGSYDNVLTAAQAYTDLVKNTLSDRVDGILLEHSDTIYAGRHFSDSDYHLGAPFRDTHTATVMSALAAALGGGVNGYT